MSEREIDPIIAEYVAAVTNRFGAPGLEDLIAAASDELVVARAALDGLGDPAE